VRRFLEELNRSLSRYYTNPLIGVSNEDIGTRYATDPRVHVLPADRGSLYLSILNAKIRAASAGKRSVDDMIAALAERERRGATADGAVWLDLASRGIGAQARRDYDAMLAGSVMLADSNTFGPCFERTSARLRRFELGFDARALSRQPRIVHGIVHGSAAEHAGLHDGDEILGPVDIEPLEDNQDAILTLAVRRGGETLTIAYVPRGEAVTAYQWRRITVVPDEACGL
jgi:predicted metalloprotease with PDZ domain